MTLQDAQRSYGCGPKVAQEILAGSTHFALAARYFGGMFVHWDRKVCRWKLFNQVSTQKRIIAEALSREPGIVPAEVMP